MPLTSSDRTTVRPRGGVTRVGLALASELVGAPDPASGFVSWAFREDRATYSRERVGAGLRPLTRHTLVMELPATPAVRAAVEQLRAADGLVARVETASGETLYAGWSERFGTGYPLRLAACESVSGAVPGDYPTIKLTLQCYD